jgi:glucokinase
MLIGIDIGGTSAKVGLVDREGAVRRRAQVPTGAVREAEELTAALAQAVRALAEGAAPAALGVAAPGMRREDGEGVINVTNLPRIDGYPLRARLEAATRLPVTLDNDANAAAMAEYRFGAGRGARRLLVITVGTGIGGGMVVGGAVHRVAWQGLGDPGHVIVRLNGPRCGCGGHGCLETLAAVPAIVRRASELRGRPFDGLGDVTEAARAGAEAPRRALEEAGGLIGMGLATLTHVLAPEVILLGGGGLDAAEDLLLEPVRASLFAHVQPFLGERLTLGRAALGNDAGLVGAAALAAACR